MLLAVDLGEAVIQTIENGVDILNGGRLDLSKLDVAGFTLIAQILATIVLILVVRFKFWKPITTMLESRSLKVTESIKQKEKAEIDAQNIKKEAEDYLASVKEESKDIIQQAKDFGNEEKNRLISEARVQIESEKEKAKLELEHQIEESKQKMKKEIVDVAYVLADKMVNAQMNEEKNQAIIDEFLQNSQSTK